MGCKFNANLLQGGSRLQLGNFKVTFNETSATKAQ